MYNKVILNIHIMWIKDFSNINHKISLLYSSVKSPHLLVEFVFSEGSCMMSEKKRVFDVYTYFPQGVLAHYHLAL